MPQHIIERKNTIFIDTTPHFNRKNAKSSATAMSHGAIVV